MVGSLSRSSRSPSSGSPPTTCFSPEGRSRLIYGEDARISQWCAQRLPTHHGWGGQYIAIGYEREGILKGGIVFTDYSPPNIRIACVLEAPLTRRFLRGIYYYPFHQLKVNRITALVDAKNRASRELLEHDGYMWEGCMREAAVNDDVMIYGLLKKDCRWL